MSQGHDKKESKSTDVWFVATDAGTFEYCLRDLQVALEQGSVRPKTLVWREGMADWVELRDEPLLRLLLPKVGAPVPLPPPPPPLSPPPPPPPPISSRPTDESYDDKTAVITAETHPHLAEFINTSDRSPVESGGSVNDYNDDDATVIQHSPFELPDSGPRSVPRLDLPSRRATLLGIGELARKPAEAPTAGPTLPRYASTKPASTKPTARAVVPERMPGSKAGETTRSPSADASPAKVVHSKPPPPARVTNSIAPTAATRAPNAIPSLAPRAQTAIPSLAPPVKHPVPSLAPLAKAPIPSFAAPAQSPIPSLAPRAQVPIPSFTPPTQSPIPRLAPRGSDSGPFTAPAPAPSAPLASSSPESIVAAAKALSSKSLTESKVTSSPLHSPPPAPEVAPAPPAPVALAEEAQPSDLADDAASLSPSTSSVHPAFRTVRLSKRQLLFAAGGLAAAALVLVLGFGSSGRKRTRTPAARVNVAAVQAPKPEPATAPATTEIAEPTTTEAPPTTTSTSDALPTPEVSTSPSKAAKSRGATPRNSTRVAPVATRVLQHTVETNANPALRTSEPKAQKPAEPASDLDKGTAEHRVWMNPGF